MQLPKLLHKIFQEEMPFVHQARLKTLLEVVEALVLGKRLTLTALGRQLARGKTRSNIRKVDRLLGNPHLQREKTDYYRALNQRLIAPGSRPRISVDWSCLSARHQLYVLRAGLSVKGRSIVVYEEVHRKKNENHHPTHQAFLRRLATVLPTRVRPILITDAGFRCPWFNAVQAMGWDYVGRIRHHNALMLDKTDTWILSKCLYARTTGTARYLGMGYLTRRLRLATHVILFKGRAKHRHALTHRKTVRRSSHSQRHAACHKEPWVLVTSLTPTRGLAQTAVALYQQRMQI